MINTILIDLDGVIIHRKQFFSELLAQRLDLDLENDVAPFFKGEFKECMTGIKNLKDVLPPWLTKWRWEGDLDSFLTFWFESEKEIDETVLAYLDTLRESGISVYLATDNEINRLNYVLDDLSLRQHFDGIFGSALIGSKKDSPEFWNEVLSSLKVPASEILFIDDDPKNTEIATELGINTLTYNQELNLSSELNNLGIN